MKGMVNRIFFSFPLTKIMQTLYFSFVKEIVVRTIKIVGFPPKVGKYKFGYIEIAIILLVY